MDTAQLAAALAERARHLKAKRARRLNRQAAQR
jgi:hypothetical protein